jgi:tRNA-dihydrouridine synthase B
MLASAALAAEEMGADIVDINMGCPAKKVCNKAAGSALLKDVSLVQDIFQQVRAAVSIPVTVKIRLGWSLEEINAPLVAKIAEDSGLSLVTVHGRSRACKFVGNVNYDQIGEVADQVDIPVIANGDILSAHDAKRVLAATGASGVMIGRAAQGKPWLPGQVSNYLENGEIKNNPTLGETKAMLMTHVSELTSFYGELTGPRIARKHVGWYLTEQSQGSQRRKQALREFNRLETVDQQLQAIEEIFDLLGGQDTLAA